MAPRAIFSVPIFILACLRQVDCPEKATNVSAICLTHELAYQIKHEPGLFAEYFQVVKTGAIYGGMLITKDKEMLSNSCPHVLMGTPGRVPGLFREKDLKLEKLTQFVLYQ